MISAALLNGRGRPSSRCSAAEPAARLHLLRPAFLPAKTTCRSSAGCTRNAPAEGWQGRWDARHLATGMMWSMHGESGCGNFAAEIHRFAADAAHGLCSIDLLFVALKGQTVRAVTVWARNGLWHMRLLGHGLLCTHREGAFAGRETSSGRGVFSKPMGALQAQGIKKAARKIRTARDSRSVRSCPQQQLTGQDCKEPAWLYAATH